ncbi:MAG: ABC transporter permease [Bacillati bacterium ANGP1]|uniref:ABC transporter permease n=1 Tax=Candidatus Segetimicrobium genomatis TaxID=2569760 RepID=A0A537JAR6_9BACT|nr:MAG: ABC transporter permease [Terrabacteria group bacterium ANGP1]
MIRYIARRLILLGPLLVGITFVSWAAIQLAPGSGDYFQSLVLQYPQISPATIEGLRARFGMDQPPWIQYLRWLWSIVHLDFGLSFAYQVPVTWLIGSRALNTLLLSITSMVAAWALAIPVGIYSAVHQYSVADGALNVSAFVAISVPSFFSALLLLYAAFWTHLLPLQGLTSVTYDVLPWWGKVLDVGWHLILPTIALGVFSVGGLMRYMRNNLLDVLRADYLKTARAKGLTERRVILRHAVRNAINPLVTLFGFELGGLLSGAAFVENVLGYPGLGRLILEAVLKKDVFVVMGSLLLGSVLLILGNLAADILLAVADPRIRYD